MIIDNTEQIKKLIAGCGKDEFYMLQILHRSKDGKTPYEPEDKKISMVMRADKDDEFPQCDPENHQKPFPDQGDVPQEGGYRHFLRHLASGRPVLAERPYLQLLRQAHLQLPDEFRKHAVRHFRGMENEEVRSLSRAHERGNSEVQHPGVRGGIFLHQIHSPGCHHCHFCHKSPCIRQFLLDFDDVLSKKCVLFVKMCFMRSPYKSLIVIILPLLFSITGCLGQLYEDAYRPEMVLEGRQMENLLKTVLAENGAERYKDFAMVVNQKELLPEPELSSSFKWPEIDFNRYSLVIGKYVTPDTGYGITRQYIIKSGSQTVLYIDLKRRNGIIYDMVIDNYFAFLYPKLPDGKLEVDVTRSNEVVIGL